MGGRCFQTEDCNENVPNDLSLSSVSNSQHKGKHYSQSTIKNTQTQNYKQSSEAMKKEKNPSGPSHYSASSQ